MATLFSLSGDFRNLSADGGSLDAELIQAVKNLSLFFAGLAGELKDLSSKIDIVSRELAKLNILVGISYGEEKTKDG
jgi:hypothetical protein